MYMPGWVHGYPIKLIQYAGFIRLSVDSMSIKSTLIAGEQRKVKHTKID